MNILKTMFFILLAMLAPRSFGATVESVDQIHFIIWDSPQSGGTTSVTIEWRDLTSGNNWISYGTTSGFYSTTRTPADSDGKGPHAPVPYPTSSTNPFWEVTLTGLTPDTTYHYSIANGPDHTFRTPPLRGSTGTFTVYSVADIGSSLSYSKVLPVMNILAGKYGTGTAVFNILQGDLTYADGGKGADAVNTHFNNVMSWSTNAAYMPAWGNHEWDTSSTIGDDFYNYLGRFYFPNSQNSDGLGTSSIYHYSPGKDWYYFYYGNTLFIAFPEPYSSSSTWGSWPPSSSPANNWAYAADQLMKTAQAATSVKFIVTFGHRPSYSSTGSDSSTLRSILDGLGKYSKYVLDLSGHAHHYERTILLGASAKTTHVVVGTGHTSVATISGTPPTWSAYRTEEPGALKLVFSANQIQGSFICAPQSSVCNSTTSPVYAQVKDSFVIGSAAPTSSLTVSITDPANSSTVWGLVPVTASVSDSGATVSAGNVKFQLDGVDLTASVATVSGGFQTNWDSTQTANGNHNLTFVATDSAGNTASDTITVSVNNLSSGGSSTTLAPSADALIKSGSPTSNYGTLTSVNADTSPVVDFLMKFDIPAPPSGMTSIGSAKLRLYCVDKSDNGGVFYLVDNTWSETAVTWNNAPQIPTNSSSVGSIGAVSANTWYEVNIPLSSLILQSNGTYSLSLRVPSASSTGNGVDYASRDASSTTRPQLVVQYQ